MRTIKPPFSANGIRVPVFPTTRVRSFPLHESGVIARYTSLSTSLSRRYTSDAHFAAYAAPDCPRRLSKAAITKLTSIAMVAFVVDVDDAHAHGTDTEASDHWFRREQRKLREVFERHPNGFVYRTRGGYRLVYLRCPFPIREADDSERWKRWYVGQLAYLATEFDVWGDPTCRDWTRLYRLPHVVRDGEARYLRRATIGEPHRIGSWDSSSDRAIDRPALSRLAESHPGWRSALRILQPANTSAQTSAGGSLVFPQWSGFALPSRTREVLRRAVARVRRSRRERNNTLNREAFIVGKLVAAGLLERESVTTVLLSAASSCGLPSAEALPTITSALDAALRQHV